MSFEPSVQTPTKQVFDEGTAALVSTPETFTLAVLLTCFNRREKTLEALNAMA